MNMRQAPNTESRRPNRSPLQDEKSEPRSEPPAMLAVIPPIVVESGLPK